MQPSVLLLSTLAAFAGAESIVMSKVFIIPITPQTFDWKIDGRHDQFSYQPSLLNVPDLPPWIHYTYSRRDHQGFLYGVAPKDQEDFQLEIVGLNKHTYETRYKVLAVNVLDKENLTRYEVHLKIDNLNVEDMFDANRTDRLLDVFRKNLWKEATDLYVTFLASAVELGARLPLKPEEGEGAVLRLGSSVPFSQDLNVLQEEVKPLWKLSSCARNFKRTTVERWFREAGFVLDWCSFRLIEENHNLHRESARRGPNMNVIGLPSSENSGHSEWRWARPTKSGTPTRSYLKETATTVFVPTALLLIFAGLLTTALCIHHEKISSVTREKRELTPVEGLGNNGVQMVQYATSERGTLKSLSAQPSSPCDSLSRSPRTSVERCNPYVRPNPPPYMGPNNVTGVRADF
ncbi:alpha-sarcoglycan isoform X2 [Orussus abietinus]|uniref:alpha-sarcoglycan isoform X2 n=1 Tax=Orussus abietinus TaxID=222816 RepID=UPI000625879B|nr:alpha-sarcoglycan isoform X2 [Orussus abietinus]